MPAGTVRSTVYVEASVHRALRLRAASTHQTISDIVNDAVRSALAGELGAEMGSAAQESEAVSYESLLARLKADLSPRGSCRVSSVSLLDRWRHLPHVDPAQFRADLDDVVDSSL